MEKGRGCLNENVQKLAKDFLGHEMTVDELRMIPYVQYLMVNEQKLDPEHMNKSDRDVWAKWKKAGHVDGGMAGMSVTKAFWDFMCNVLWETYVDIN